MTYMIEDLEEGNILDFGNGKYGIVTYENPSFEFRNGKKSLACVYSFGGWDYLENVISKEFKLYESPYPMYTFLNLLNKRIDFCAEFRGLKVKKRKYTKQQIANELGVDVDEFEIVE